MELAASGDPAHGSRCCSRHSRTRRQDAHAMKPEPDRQSRRWAWRLNLGTSMLGLRTHALVTGGLFAALLVFGWGGNAVDAYGLVPHTPGVQIGAVIFFLLLTVALAFSAVPLMVLLVVRFHIAAGN